MGLQLCYNHSYSVSCGYSDASAVQPNLQLECGHSHASDVQPLGSVHWVRPVVFANPILNYLLLDYDQAAGLPDGKLQPFPVLLAST